VFIAINEYYNHAIYYYQISSLKAEKDGVRVGWGGPTVDYITVDTREAAERVVRLIRDTAKQQGVLIP
jgi:hypothetical protein